MWSRLTSKITSRGLSRTRLPLRYTSSALGLVAFSFALSSNLHALSAPTPGSGVFKRSEVARHATVEDRVWVILGTDVYDVTEFVESHPGGSEKLMLAAGGQLEPFWNLYRQHYDLPAPMQHLSKYKIGSLDPHEKPYKPTKEELENDPYANEPTRHAALVKHAHGTHPFNSETVLDYLSFPEDPHSLRTTDFLTPNELFFVRHHHPTPDLAAEDFRLTVDVSAHLRPRTWGEAISDSLWLGPTGATRTPGVYSFSLAELKRLFPEHAVTTTIQCAGNRRSEYSPHGKTQGLPWKEGAISTSTWAGARVKDILAYCRFQQPDPAAPDSEQQAQHVWFTAADAPWDASIPIQKAISDYGDVILAYKQNASDVPRDHGFPLRAIVPGHLGARNVKWVTELKASSEESVSNWQRGVPYKGMSPNVKSFKNVSKSTIAATPAVQELPVTSCIVHPRPGTSAQVQVDAATGVNTVEVEGYAYAGGGRGIVRVDVSSDNGQTWHTADIRRVPGQTVAGGRAWAWSLWRCEVPVEVGVEAADVCVRAVDSSYNTQPENTRALWNLRGILNNAWHTRSIALDDQ